VSARVKMVTASRGKIVRAEPIVAFYEQNRIRHIVGLAALEDQLVCFTTDGYVGDRSPDNADAAIWALTELMLPGANGSAWLELAADYHSSQAAGGASAPKR
jgi:phage terminase large subunit-like protein